MDRWMDVYVLGRTGITQWTDRISVLFGSFIWSSSPFFLWNCCILVVGTSNIFIPQALITCYVSSVEHTWWKVYSGIQSGRTGHQQLIKLRFFFIFFFFFNLCVMYVEWRQRMDIIWEILIILQANFIVCISGELWASFGVFSGRCITQICVWIIRNFSPDILWDDWVEGFEENKDGFTTEAPRDAL